MINIAVRACGRRDDSKPEPSTILPEEPSSELPRFQPEIETEAPACPLNLDISVTRRAVMNAVVAACLMAKQRS